MTPEEIAAEDAANAAAQAKVDADKAAADAASEDPVKKELSRVQKNKPRTEAEKAAFTLKSTAARLTELGGDPRAVLGLEEQQAADVGEDDKPVTVGMLRKLEADKAQKTSLQMADEIQDSDERELVRHHLEHTIRPSGNPQEDLKAARAIVNSVKNTMVAEEAARGTRPRNHGSAAGAPGRHTATIELSTEELQYTRAPFNMTPEEIVKTRRS